MAKWYKRFLTPYAVQWIILCTGLLILGLVMGIHSWNYYDQVMQLEKKRLLDETHVVEQILGKNLEALNVVLDGLRQVLAAGTSKGDINQRLEALVRGVPGVHTILVYDADGNVLAASEVSLLGESFAHREYFKKARQLRDTDTVLISAPFHTALGIFAINVVKRIPGDDTRFNGIVGAILDPGYFAPLLQSVLYAPDMWTSLMHSDGVLFLIEPERPDMQGMSIAKPDSFFSRHVENGMDVNVEVGEVCITGEKRLVATRTVHLANVITDNYLVVAASRDYWAMLSHWREDLLRDGLLLTLALIGSVTWLAVYQRRRRELERKAREVEERYRLLLLSLTEGVYGTDAQGDITFINPSGTALLGYDDPGELLGRNSHELIHHSYPDGSPYPKEKCPLHNAIGQKSRMSNALEVFWRKDGTAFDVAYFGSPLLCDDKVVGAVVTFMDISEHKRDQERMKKLTDRLRLATSAAGIGIWEYDAVSDEFMWDEGMYKLYGVDPEHFDLDSPGWEAMVHADDLEKAHEAFQESLRSGDNFNAEFRITRVIDGAQRHIETKGLVQRDADGIPLRVLGLNLDVTERKVAAEELQWAHDQLELRVGERTSELRQAMEELEKARDKAESASRMKTDFLMNVSHELRTPLNGILGMLQLLDNIDLEEEYAEYLAEAFKAGGRMHKLVEDLISVTRLENHTLMLVPVSLRTLRDVFVHTLNPMAREKGLIVRDGMDPECPSIMISDVDLLRMVLIKLGENAIKFTDQGSVELHIGAESKADDVYLFRFTVTDTGRGIAEENIDTVVSGLAQEETALNRHFGGLGLGIEAIRKALVLLGGALNIESSPEKGARFVVSIESRGCDMEGLDRCLAEEWPCA